VKIVAIIQARMGSSRLPGKVLADICGRPMLYYVHSRAQQARSLNLVTVATSNQPSDDVVESFCATSGVPCFRGSQNDVLDRYYRAAKHFDSDIIVRLTADCPLLDPIIIDKVVQTFISGGFDYVSNCQDPTYPDGLDTEVFTWKALERAWQDARRPSEREHVTAYITNNPELFRIECMKNGEDFSRMRWTVDEPADLELVRQIYRLVGERSTFGMNEILALFDNHPELYAINAGFARNEGYEKSLRDDRFQIIR
jgi:spore coat polysaccharide biosynthesis protein SpsF